MMKAIAKYPGSKWSLSEWIISFFPKHHSYLEPFFGSGAVLFNKTRSHIETVNDLDQNVVNLFECIREDPKKLAEMVYGSIWGTASELQGSGWAGKMMCRAGSVPMHHRTGAIFREK